MITVINDFDQTRDKFAEKILKVRTLVADIGSKDVKKYYQRLYHQCQ